MKALKILNGRLKELKGASRIVRMDNSHLKFDKPIKYIEEAIKELEEYESDMDKYLDYTTNSRCSKSFNSCLSSVKSEYDIELEKIIKENSQDRLAKLEKVILDYYLAKGYQVGVGGWGFSVQINSDYKDKNIEVFFSDKQNNEKEFDSVVTIMEETTKKMFDKAFEYFTLNKKETNVK